MRQSRFCRMSCLLLFPCLGFIGCTETDPGLHLVGGLRLIPVATDLSLPTLDEPGIQATSWNVMVSRITYDDFTYDLTSGSPCTISSSVRAQLPVGDCPSGIAGGVTETPGPALVEFSATLEIRRLEPPSLPDGGDHDGDGVLNEDDNCPVASNFDQEDLFGAFETTGDPPVTNVIGDGIGDECQIQTTTGALLDSDADHTDTLALIDSSDNCPWTANPDQLDTTDPIDGIGDACVTQVAQVMTLATSDPLLTIPVLDFEIDVQINNVWVTVDFKPETALVCDWNAGSCTLDLSQVQVCQLDSNLAVLFGCP